MLFTRIIIEAATVILLDYRCLVDSVDLELHCF